MVPLLLALLVRAHADEPGTCPDDASADTGVITANLACATACDGCCAEDGTCLDGTADDACGIAETCQDCTSSGDSCQSGTCQSVAWTSFSYHDDDELDVRSIEGAARARSGTARQAGSQRAMRGVSRNDGYPPNSSSPPSPERATETPPWRAARLA